MNKALAVNEVFITGCKDCLNARQQTSLYARKWERDRMKENYRADMLQRYDGDKLDKDWVKMHTDKAIEQFGQDYVTEVLRK